MRFAEVSVESDTDGAPGLRERSKARRRAHIREVAMRLFAERGYAATTVADIADAADLAPRTVSGYFPNKVDIATSFADEIAGRLTQSFAVVGDGDLLAVFDHWLRGEAEVLDPAVSALATAMYDANPELGALSSAHMARAAHLAATAIAERLGRAPADPMVAVCDAAIGGALGAYLRATAQRRPSEDLHREMLRFIDGLVAAAAVAAPTHDGPE